MSDYGDLRTALDTITHVLGALRSGDLRLDGTRHEDTLDTIDRALTVLDLDLGPRLDGVRDALIRAHYDAGGSHSEAARASGVPLSTASTRADRIRRAEPTAWEAWATADRGGSAVPADQVRPGWTVITDDGRRAQVTEVVERSDDQVAIVTPHGTHTHPRDVEVRAVRRDASDIWTSRGDMVDVDGTTVTVTTHRRI